MYFVMASAVGALGAGCESNVDHVKSGSWGSYTAPYGEVFARAFENGVWSEERDEKGEKYVQFTGQISRELHDFAVDKIKSSDQKILIQSACGYLASLNRDGRISQDKDITFDVSEIPIKEGIVVYERIGSFIKSPDNSDVVTALNEYYLNRYWEAGSDVLFQWSVYSGGRVLKIRRVANTHWSDDPLFSGRPESIMRVLYDYVAQ